MIRKGLIGFALILAALVIFFTARLVFMQMAMRGNGVQLGLQRHEAPRDLGAFSFLDEKGKPHTLDEWHGQVVILNLWGTWCPPCRREMPALSRLQSDLAGENIVVLTLNLDHPGQVPPALWLQREGLDNLPAFHGNDKAILAATNTIVVPTTLILDRQGRERARLIGAADWDKGQLRMMIAYYAQ